SFSETTFANLLYNETLLSKLGRELYYEVDRVIQCFLSSLQSLQQKLALVKAFHVQPEHQSKQAIGRIFCMGSILARCREWANTAKLKRSIIDTTLRNLFTGMVQCCPAVIMHKSQQRNEQKQSMFHLLWANLCFFVHSFNNV